MAYRLIDKVELKDLQGQGYVYEHNLTKARVCIIKTDDDNKSFSISFRTPPVDDTGIPHILEHSVLCGSRKYPIKDPFIELAKGSLNTFLNAITYSDKTMYPVASVNDKDFHNLIDVYMDAVFFPDIYNNPLTFEQEGWHHELLEQDGSVTYKGVVYNEMKGVFSSPEQVLYRKIQQEMFNNHPYSYESGGDPMAIPSLTYERFLDFHKNYYHPSNAYIFFYGDIDIQRELDYLDSEYLSEFDFREVDSSIPKVEKYKKAKSLAFAYPVGEGDHSDKYYFSYSVLLSESKEVLEGVGFDILEYLMIDAPGATIKEALIKEGIGQDVFCNFDGGIRQGTFSIIAKNCRIDQKDRFVEVIEEELGKLKDHGFDNEKVQAAINRFEFRAKEADFGQFPKGVIYAIKAMETWLYDESPFINFHYDEIFDLAKKASAEGLLQRLIDTYFLSNNHKLILTLAPDPDFNNKKQGIIDEKLAEYEKGLSKEERADLIEHNKALIKFQETPESKENLEKLPLLTLKDIPRDKKEFLYQSSMIKEAKLLFREALAANIIYVKASFDVGFVKEEHLPMLSLLSRMLIKTSTKDYHYSQLSDAINSITGGVSTSLSVYEHKKSNKYYTPKLEISGKCFVPKLKDMLALFTEILENTDFSDPVRIRELLNETKSRMQMGLFSSGHGTASLRAQSYFSPAAAYKEKLRGLEFYEEVKLWQTKSDDDLKDLGHMLNRLLSDIVVSDRLTLGVTASGDYKETIISKLDQYVHNMPCRGDVVTKETLVLRNVKNEGIKTTSDVQYVAMAADFTKHGFNYEGSLKVLNTIINLDYLWNTVRIKGGAYGAFANISRNGSMYFVSYRDPNLAETLDAYRHIYKFISQIDFDDRELTKYIIGTVSHLDHPLTPSLENDKMMSLYHTEISHEEILSNRHSILDTSVEKLREHVEMYEKILLDEYICVVGGSEKIDENKALFDKTIEVE